MDRDDFIIAVFLVICEHYQAIKEQYRLRRGGFAPALTDEEVITMEICGEYFKLECDKDIFHYFRKHYLHFFPKLTDRSLFVRQAANLWQVKAAIQKRLVVMRVLCGERYALLRLQTGLAYLATGHDYALSAAGCSTS